MLAKIARGHRGRRHGGAAAGASARRARAVDRPIGAAHTGPALRPGEGPHPGRRPDQDRQRIPRSVVVGRRVGHRRAGRRGAVRRVGIRRTRRRAGRGGPRRASVVDVEPAVRRVGRGARYPVGAVGSRAPARHRRHLRDAARARQHRRLRRRRRTRHRHRASRGGTAGRMRHPRRHARIGCRAQGRRGRRAQGSAARRRHHPRRHVGGDHRDRPDRQPGDGRRGQAAGGQAAQHR